MKEERDIQSNGGNALPGTKESLGVILSELAHHSSALVRNELELARTELAEKAASYRTALVVLVTGGALLLLSLMIWCAAAIIGLASQVGWLDASLIVAGAVTAIALLLTLIGFVRLRQINPRLKNTMNTLEENTQWVQTQVKS